MMESFQQTKNFLIVALAGVAQWTERRPANQRVAGSVPNQDTCLGCGARSPVGSVQEATTH